MPPPPPPPSLKILIPPIAPLLDSFLNETLDGELRVYGGSVVRFRNLWDTVQ